MAHKPLFPLQKYFSQILSNGSGSDGFRRQNRFCAYRRQRSEETEGEEDGQGHDIGGAKSEKRASQREAAKKRLLAARLDEERRQETERYLIVQALANSEELAGNAVMWAIMRMKHEALNVVFGGAVFVAPPHPLAGAFSTISVTSTLSGRPPLAPRMPGAHAPSPGAHARTVGMLSRLDELRPLSLESAVQAIDLN
jgi:hypothetical protein